MNRQEYREKLAAKLRGARAESALTQMEVKAATGISTAHLSRIENGLDPIDFEELLQVAELYDVALERLLDNLVPLGEPPSTTRASSNRQRQDQAA